MVLPEAEKGLTKFVFVRQYAFTLLRDRHHRKGITLHANTTYERCKIGYGISWLNLS